jgi:hypothetical protein
MGRHFQIFIALLFVSLISSTPDSLSEIIVSPSTYLPSPQNNSTDVIGDTVTVGTTWVEIQHHGTIGRMIEKDELDYVHFAWMNGLNYGAIDRHVYYNAIDTQGGQCWPGTGYPVESSQRAGYVTLDVGFGGLALPAFHEKVSASVNYHTAVAVDFFPHAGAFLIYEPDWQYVHGVDVSTVWPNIRIGSNELIHVVATGLWGELEQNAYGLYTVGTYIQSIYTVEFPSAPDTWTPIGEYNDCVDIATSDVSDRIAIGWMNLHRDIMVLIDEDGYDLDFDETFNLTRFIPPDSTLLPDTTLANRDTLRCHSDMTLFIDDQDYLHVAFTTAPYFFFGGPLHYNSSIIWHWSEQYPYDYSVVAHFWDVNDVVDCGPHNRKVQRPSLGQNPETGDIYCMYQVYDTDSTALSSAGWPSGEVYMSVSVDGGLNWAVGTNVTETVTPSGAPAWQCYSEECPNMTTLVDDSCHVMYVLDRDAGDVGQGCGTWTLNEVKYHMVPISQVPSTPTVPQLPFHVAPLPPDQDIITEEMLPSDAVIDHKTVPNPFNPNTTIRFTLEQAAHIKLRIYDISGRTVAAIADGWRDAGPQQFIFDGSNLASGVYFYVLRINAVEYSGKMVLMK